MRKNKDFLEEYPPMFTALQTSVGGVVGEHVAGGGHVGVALHQRGHGQPQRLGQEQRGDVGQSRLQPPRVSVELETNLREV